MKQESSYEQKDRTVWSTTLIFLTMIVLTALMVFGVKALLTGSSRSSLDGVEIRATK